MIYMQDGQVGTQQITCIKYGMTINRSFILSLISVSLASPYAIYVRWIRVTSAAQSAHLSTILVVSALLSISVNEKICHWQVDVLKLTVLNILKLSASSASYMLSIWLNQ